MPKPNKQAFCPLCNGDVISKCGKIKTWHWAHKKAVECDAFGQTDTEWRNNWKTRFPFENQEIPVNKHLADVLTDNNEVIRFQDTKINSEGILMCEKIFGNMIWIYNGEKHCDNFIIDERIGSDDKVYYTFTWLRPIKSTIYTKKPTFLDFGPKMFLFKKMYVKEEKYCGWGYFFDTDKFFNIRHFNGVKRIEKLS